ncbi:DUF6463 family protein [Wenzhouxiangella sp. AB-CW3]|uniref:DUF6463 family protein n=1 Tax=Wenzhouxiangella sp. AB-CW3 TaxID=2771012 RepID=UPI001CC30D63|nr:DUF6463 family protein [Wenzhouxiangella sp. AB-CW3]
MISLAKYSGWYLLATGIIHNTIGLVTGWGIIAGIHADGWWNSIQTGGEMDFARSAMLWFLVLGFFWMMLGHLMQQWLNHTGRPLPAQIGWGLLANGVLVAMVLPASGAWLVIAQGLLILLGGRKSEPAR